MTFQGNNFCIVFLIELWVSFFVSTNRTAKLTPILRYSKLSGNTQAQQSMDSVGFVLLNVTAVGVAFAAQSMLPSFRCTNIWQPLTCCQWQRCSNCHASRFPSDRDWECFSAANSIHDTPVFSYLFWFRQPAIANQQLAMWLKKSHPNAVG